VSEPHKVRVTTTKKGPNLLVAGRSAAVLLSPAGAFPKFEALPLDLGDGNHLRYLDDAPLLARRFGGFHALEVAKSGPTLRKLVPEIDGPYVDFRLVGDDLLTSYGRLYRRSRGAFPKAPTRQFALPKDWTFLAVGDFNGDGKPDAAFLGYGMEKETSARVYYGRGEKKALTLGIGRTPSCR